MQLLALAIYSLALIAISWRYFRKAPSAESFGIDERTTRASGVFASTITLIGGGELLVVASLAFASDGGALTLLTGYGLGLVILGALARRFRRNSSAHLYNNLPDYFYGEYGPFAGVVSSLLTAAAFFALLVLQFSAGTLVLTSLAPLSSIAAALLSAAVVVAYLLLAGYRGVVLTDKIQLVVMLIGLPLLAGLLAPGVEIAAAFAGLTFTGWGTIAMLLTGIFVILGSGDIWQRLVSARDDRAATKGLVWAGVGFTLFGALLAFIGVAARLQNLTTDPDSAFIVAALSIPNPYLSAVIILTVFSALLSTADTETFLLSGMVAREVSRWRGGFKNTRDASLGTSVVLSRWMIVAVALIAAITSVVAPDLVTIYTVLIYLLLAMAGPVLVGAFRKLNPTVVVIATVLSAALLLLIPFGLLALENAVLIAVPGLALCILTPYEPLDSRPQQEPEGR